MTEVQINPLQTVIDEFKTLSPGTTNALIFESNGQLVASTQSTTEDQTKKLILNFGRIVQNAQAIGGIESLTIQAADSQLCITAMNNFYLATVSSRAANPEIVKSLTQVLVPIIVRLVDQVASKPEKNYQQQDVQIAEEPDDEETVLPVAEETKTESPPEPKIEPKISYEPHLPSTPVNQLMVEKIGGLLVPPDTVRIDGKVIAQWSELYGNRQITKVNIEALDGKKTTCKFKPIKEARAGAKGIIQIPEKILQTLQTEKGKLIMVKPLIE